MPRRLALIAALAALLLDGADSDSGDSNSGDSNSGDSNSGDSQGSESQGSDADWGLDASSASSGDSDSGDSSGSPGAERRRRRGPTALDDEDLHDIPTPAEPDQSE